ncbi:MAG: hypothetical protein MJ176_08325 [Treponema sp.]|nr:hypothetical protein [Treponema sp.]
MIFLVVDLLLFFVFLMGNYQTFSDSSQIMILETMSVFSFLLICFSLIIFVSHIISFITRHKKFLSGIIQMVLMILCMAVGISLLFFSNMMNVISAGL